MTSRFIYFGTPEVASQTLEHLIAAGYVPALVVTSPDAPRGRGLVLTPSPTRTVAEAHGIAVITPSTLDPETIATIRALAADYAVCVAYGKIFPESLIGAFPLGVLNIHYSLLPKYRGATPLEGALLAGERETGVTIQKMVRALDAGDRIAQSVVPIGSTETARELRPRLIELGAQLLVTTLPQYLAGHIEPQPQDAALATHSGKFKKEDGLLDLTAPAEDNWNKYRAFTDSIGTHFFIDGVRHKVTKASLMNGRFVVERVVPEGKREIPYPIH